MAVTDLNTMNFNASEMAIASVSTGFAALTYTLSQFQPYAGGGYEFVAPLLGLAWVLANARARQTASSDDSEVAA